MDDETREKFITVYNHLIKANEHQQKTTALVSKLIQLLVKEEVLSGAEVLKILDEINET